MHISSLRIELVCTLLLFGLLLVLVPRAGFSGDVGYWQEWALYSFRHGLGNVYQLENNNYNPVFHWLLWLYGKLLGSSDKLRYYIHWIKSFTLVFDFAGAFWAASLPAERSRRFGLALLLLLNLGYLYNTLVWVQVDSIYSFFAFGAVVLAVQRRLAGSAACFVLALLTKTQAIVFLPVLLLLWGPMGWQRPRQAGWAGLAAAGTALLVLAPFIWGGWENYLPHIFRMNLRQVGLFPYVSMHAYNLWYLLKDVDGPGDMTDSQVVAGLTYHTWGLIWFCLASALALWPLLVAAWGMVRARPGQLAAGAGLPLALLSGGIIPLLFAFFNTEMHERYWHPALLFLAAYGFLRRDYLPFVLMSVAYFLQLERVLNYLNLLNYKVVLFKPAFIAGLFGTLILLVLVKIYRLAPWQAAPSAAPPPGPAA